MNENALQNAPLPDAPACPVSVLWRGGKSTEAGTATIVVSGRRLDVRLRSEAEHRALVGLFDLAYSAGVSANKLRGRQYAAQLLRAAAKWVEMQ